MNQLLSIDMGFSPIVIAILVITLISIIVGIAAIIIVILALFGFISAGVISSSIIVGIYNKSITKGFKFLVLASFTTIGAVGLGGIWVILNKILHWFSLSDAIITGLLGGGFAGLCLGHTVYFIIQHFSDYIKKKFNIGN